MSWYIWHAQNYLPIQNTLWHWIQEIRRRLCLRTKSRKRNRIPIEVHRQETQEAQNSIYPFSYYWRMKSNFLKVTVISFAYLSACSLLVLFCVPLNGSIFLTLFDKWFGTARDNCEKRINLIWDRQSTRANVSAYGHWKPLKLRSPSAFLQTSCNWRGEDFKLHLSPTYSKMGLIIFIKIQLIMETISINKFSMRFIFAGLNKKGQFSGKFLDRYW